MAKVKAFDKSNSMAASSLYGGALSLTVFWLLVVLKAAYQPLSDFLNWYDPVGPLLGTFGVGLLVFLVGAYAFDTQLKATSAASPGVHEKRAALLFMLSIILVFFMTFPPIFEPIVEILS
jgi:hypothetical protein